MWREHLYSVFHPRRGVRRSGWEPPDGSIAVADQPISSAAVDRFPRSAVIFHYSPFLDAAATRNFKPYVVQEARSSRTAARRVPLALAYSERVSQRLGRPARVVPIAYPLPATPLPLTEGPVAALMANWVWPPNRLALRKLLAIWPSVLERVPSARLLVAGRMMDRDAWGLVPRVEFLGKVGAAVDVLSRAAVLAFPCPPSSGPKVKVLEALAYGVPVVTTAAGVEGLALGEGDGAVVPGAGMFADDLAALLVSPERRAELAEKGRAAVEAHHSPVASARARLDALSEAFDPAPSGAAPS